MLKSITIRNLRGIKECIIKDLNEVNILIGKNGSGKSTILEAIYLASAWINPQDNLHGKLKFDYIISRRTGRGNWARSRDVIWFMMDTNEAIEINLFFDSQKSMEFKIFHDVNEPDQAIWLRIPKSLESKIPRISEGYEYCNLAHDIILNPKTHSRDAYHIKDFISPLFKDEINFLRGTTLIDSRALTQPEVIEKTIWPKLLAKRLDKLIINIIREGFEPSSEDLTYMPIAGAFTLALKLSRTTVRVDDLGNGTRAAILLASILSTTGNTIMLIEDPENHQHPKGLATIMRFTLKMAKERELQLLMTTHNIELIDMLLEEAEKQENLNNIAIYKLTLEEGNLNATRYEAQEAIQLRKELNYDLRA
ncbi:MAG: AAA family ATPase [Candidatus Nezhaarchaeales archaeon]